MASARKLILVADQEEMYRDALEDALTQANYEVITTGDAAGVKELLEEFPMVDLLLLSMNLPGKDSWKVLEHIKRDTHTVDCPVFCIGGEANPDDIARLRNLGVEGLIERAMDQDEILYRVNQFLFPSGRERRSAPRAIVHGSVTYRAMNEVFHGLLFNISSTGIFIRTDYPLAPDTAIQLEFQLRGMPRQIRCAGRVARVVVSTATAGPGESRGIGVKFTTISPADTAIIREYVERQLMV